MPARRLIYNPALGRVEPSYTCAMCEDRQRITVPLAGEPWDQDCLYIRGDSVSILCPFCLTPSERDTLLAARQSWSGFHSGREVRIDWEYLRVLQAARKGELPYEERKRRAAAIREEQVRLLEEMERRQAVMRTAKVAGKKPPPAEQDFDEKGRLR